MNRHKIRVLIEIFQVLLFCWLYIPHLFVYALLEKRDINADLNRWRDKTYIKMPRILLLLYKLHLDSYFRTIFYHRIGPVNKMLIGWYRRGASTFRIPPSLKIGGGLYAPHCYATVLNAQSIGSNFTVLQCTTLGKASTGKPIIEDNVQLGANVNIIGGVTIAQYTMVGAGSVVTKNTPPHSVVAGVPAKVIKIKDV